MVRRDRDQRRVGGVGTGELDRAHQVRGEVTVAQHRRFGCRRGATGVEEHGRQFGVVGGRTLTCGAVGFVEQIEEVVALVGAGQRGPGVVTGPISDHHRAGMGCDHLVELLGAQPVVQRDERNTGDRCAEEGDRQGRMTRAEVEHGGGAVGLEQIGSTTGQIVECGVGQVAVSRADRRLITQTGRDHLQHQRQVHDPSNPTTAGV